MDQDVDEKISKHQSEYPQSRMIVGIADDALRNSLDDSWVIKNVIKNNLFIRDLFNYKLPIQPHQYFYGREQVVASLTDNVRKCQNSGLFGLRKTGKTSVLLRVSKILENDPNTFTIFIDCKKRFIRRLDCDGLIGRIVKQLDSVNSTNFFKQIGQGVDATEVLEKVVERIGKGKRLCLIFDEIEYIAPISPTNAHWKDSFVDFWQAVWSIQSETQKICFIVCGVNPSVCEESRFTGSTAQASVQNPMFGIVNIEYLRGFDLESLRRMMTFFGRRMGLIFSNEAIEYVFTRFGGHPLLSRLACSFYHETFHSAGVQRPIEINVALEQRMEIECDAEISSYCEHVVSEVREFYPQEFELLSLAARHESEAFYEMARSGRALPHIYNYGLIDRDRSGPPRVNIPVLERYLQLEYMRNRTVHHYRNLINPSDRVRWLDRKKKTLEGDFPLLNNELRETGSYDLFSGGSLRRIGDFLRCEPVTDDHSLSSFLITANLVFVENIERHLKTSGKKFWVDFKRDFPELFTALLRIKVYRHNSGHLELEGEWKERYDEFIINDFGTEGRKIVNDEPFFVQQIVLEELHIALQYEIARL